MLGMRGHAEEGALIGREAIMGEASVVLDEKASGRCLASSQYHKQTKYSGWTMEFTDTS